MRLLYLLVLPVISAGLGTSAAARETAVPLSTACSTSCVPMASAPGAPSTGGAGIVVNVPVGPGQEPASVSPRRGGERVRPAQVANGKVVRGEAVLVTGENLPTDPNSITVRLGRYKLGPPSKVSPDGTWLVFVVPERLPEDSTEGAGRQDSTGPSESQVAPTVFPLGKHRLRLDDASLSAKNPMPIPLDDASSTVEVTSESVEPVRLLSVDPQTSYANGDVVSFTLLGTGFSRVGEDNKILIKDKEVPVCWSDTCSFQALAVGSARKEARTPALGKVVSEHQLSLENVPIGTFAGAATLQVRVGDSASNKITTLLSGHGKLSVRLISGAVVALLVVLVLWLAGSGRSLSSPPNGSARSRRARVRDALFLDEETQSYSLTKFQFYAWTGAALLGYVYLTLSRSLVQGELQFGDIPQGLPGIVAIGTATGITSLAVTSTKGSKGAGPVTPSWRDFITTGGIVVAERLQYFVWTLVGVAAFVYLVLSHDPADIRDLPRVPDGFLLLTGLSAFGYLGGKLARQPGPVVKEVGRIVDSPKCIEVRGRNLSLRARIMLDGSEVPHLQLSQLRTDASGQRVEPVGTSGEFTDVLLACAEDEGVWKRGTLSVMNPDGQRADYFFDEDSPRGRQAASEPPLSPAPAPTSVPTS